MPVNNSVNNIRIAKNTLALYARMLLMMVISLFTSRVILDSLGEVNYGIYTVVGGFVAMFSILSGPLSGAIQRFLAFEIGKEDVESLKKVFSTSVSIQIIMAVTIIIVAEIVGLWFLNTKMNIPAERMEAAHFVLQCSIATFALSLLSLPYNATIIAHEKMSIFAYISILEAVLKLGIAYLIYISPIDQLKVYSALLLGVAFIIQFIYYIYCKNKFEEARYNFKLDKALFKEMAGFAGWNFFGSAAYMFNTQGVNMLINVFFGVKVNAARAIAVQVDTAMSQFVNSFTTAINPQITKSYASGNTDYLYKLITYGSKFSFFIMLIMVVPVVLEADTILGLWLKKVPDDTVIFLRLVILSTLASTMGNSMMTGVLATGNIKRYQIKMNVGGCLTFPLTWLAYLMGAPAFSTYIILLVMNFSLHFVRLDELKRLIDFPAREFIRKHITRMLGVLISSFVLPAIICHFWEPSFVRLIIICFTSVLWSFGCIYFIGLLNDERKYVINSIRSVIDKYTKNNKVQ